MPGGHSRKRRWRPFSTPEHARDRDTQTTDSTTTDPLTTRGDIDTHQYAITRTRDVDGSSEGGHDDQNTLRLGLRRNIERVARRSGCW